ncbi:response regulator [Hymenobacter lucidus]|uniref:Response regulator n=1 Tax=Hymenobacter lucidus TaxID=2880930 RepID=A0ABS8ALZ5_9BACT|nr:response regulator [Hymenobacter lucidus]MCB2407232.1 response regulator [Hymenobacter lucidus]
MPTSYIQLPSFEPALRVLVVDDNELNQLVVCRALEDWNVETTLADNGRQAVSIATAQPFDAILMDIQMPEMDGYEATRQLRGHARLRQLPIIGLTASASAQDQARALEAGMNATLPKPFDPVLLHASLLRFTSPGPPAPAATTTASDFISEQNRAIFPNWDLLEELAAGSESFIAQIISTFLQQTPVLYQQLLAASTAPDLPAQARLAHKLKGQVVYFGVPVIQQHLEKLERPATSLNAANSRYLVEIIGRQLTALYPHLEHRMRNSAAE